MGKLLFLLIVSIFYLIGCTQQKNVNQQLNLYDSAYIKLTVVNCYDTTHLTFITMSMLPSRPVTKILDITHDGTYHFSHKTIKPEFIEIDFKRKFQTYVIPGDTLKIYANLDSCIKEEEVIKIDGVPGKIFDYFSKKQKVLGYWNESYLLTEFSNNKYSLEKSISLADSIFQDQINFLNTYQKKYNLPVWFFKTLKADYEYKRIYWRPYLISVRKFFFKEKINNPENYYIFENMPLYNPEAILSDTYYKCIGIYFMSNHDLDLEGKSGIDRAFPLFARSIPDAKKILKGNVLEYFLANKMSELFEISRELKHLKMCDSLFSTLKDQFTNDEIVKILKTQRDVREKYLNDKLVNLRILKPGDRAPEFELIGLDKKKHKLSEFGGNIVYLHFWATWCGPCISEIPYVNELITKASKSNFIVINICLDNDINKWKQLINDHRLQGINLICDNNWSKRLTSQYNISAIPQYTLVSKTGSIINSKGDRPRKIIGSLDSLISSL
jgi:thiol-disulfide isomerase/thioredoxin